MDYIIPYFVFSTEEMVVAKKNYDFFVAYNWFFSQKNGCGLYIGFPKVKKACGVSLEQYGTQGSRHNGHLKQTVAISRGVCTLYFAFNEPTCPSGIVYCELTPVEVTYNLFDQRHH